MKHIYSTGALLLAMTLMLAGCSKTAEKQNSSTQSDLGQTVHVSKSEQGESSEETKGQYKIPQDLKGQKLSVQAGTTGEDAAKTLSDEKQISAFEKYADAITELKQGKVEACIMDGEPAKLIVEQNDDLMILDEALTSESYAIAVKKGHDALLKVINEVIQKQKDAGEIEKMVAAYIEDEEKAASELNLGELGEGKELLVMGTEAGFAPYESWIGDQIAGSDVWLAAECAKAMGKSLKVEDMAFDGLLSALENGQIDLVAAGLTVNPERQKVVDFSVPYFEAKQVVVIRKASYQK